MSVTTTIKDKYNNPITNIELLQNNNKESNKRKNKSNKFFLRNGKPGHLFLKPIYTAFTKNNLGSIPSNNEITLIKTDTNKPISKIINNTITSFNKKKDLNFVPKEEKDIRNYTTSFSSKGYGVGFVSQTSRFSDNLSGYRPGPGDYYSERNLSILSKIEGSSFGKSLFKTKTTMSLKTYNDDFTPFSKNRSLSNSKEISNTDISNEKYLSEKKGTYYFNSTSDRFFGGVFDLKNFNPGPGKYFFDTNNITVKEPEKLSPGFMSPQEKIINPIKYYGINKHEKKKFGFHLSNKNKNGKIIYTWKGLKNSNNEDNLSNIKKIDNLNTSIENNSTKITSKVSNNNNSSFFPSIYFGDKKNKYNTSKTEYMSISPEYNMSNLNGLDEIKMKNNKFANNIKRMVKFKRKDLFSLSSPRWDEGYYHDNDSHFQTPGPAYYEPKLQTTKKSFNLNKKDFVFANSLPFKNEEIYSTSSVLI